MDPHNVSKVPSAPALYSSLSPEQRAQYRNTVPVEESDLPPSYDEAAAASASTSSASWPASSSQPGPQRLARGPSPPASSPTLVASRSSASTAPYRSPKPMSCGGQSRQERMAAAATRREELKDAAGCCCSSTGGCCFSSYGGCCFSSNGGCCFSDHGGCCFADHGGCCCTDGW
ncbi:hypothetical protein VTK73DRAFT_1341 [Phialemonium thermophilum]|uniref:Cysteine-rich transmembrane CYSTM domain-containing protein n=1 Tax=Phialemonium thermophilum TaxID=223376 RepID=A0ABR3VTM4_9PEZI